MTILVVDARSRAINTFVASITQVTGYESVAVVLRMAKYIGPVQSLHGNIIGRPILVVGYYNARSSAGHTTFVQHPQKGCLPLVWIGGLGFPYINKAGEVRGKSLRPFVESVPAWVIPAGAYVGKVDTYHVSNRATTEAVLEGMQLQAQFGAGRISFLAEGQSDRVSGTSFEVPEDSVAPVFPEEHRSDIFSPEKMFETALNCQARGQEGCKALLIFRMFAALKAGKNPAEFAGYRSSMPALARLMGVEQFASILDGRVAVIKDAGWKSAYVDNCWAKVILPSGEIWGGEEPDDTAFRYDADVRNKFAELADIKKDSSSKS